MDQSQVRALMASTTAITITSTATNAVPHHLVPRQRDAGHRKTFGDGDRDGEGEGSRVWAQHQMMEARRRGDEAMESSRWGLDRERSWFRFL